MRSAYIFLLACLFSTGLVAQVYVEHPSPAKGMVQASVQWIQTTSGLDLITSGEEVGRQTKVATYYFKQSNGNRFSTQATGLPDFYRGSSDVGDFNQDGRNDMVLSGMGAGGNLVSGVYLQNGNGTFSKADVQIPALVDGSVQFGDFNKDNSLDVLITGRDASNRLVSAVLRNDGGKLSRIETPLPGIHYGMAAFGDVNGDGYPEILLTGQSSKGLITQVYANQGGTFRATSQEFPGLKHSAVAWADFNGDDVLDFVLAGADENEYPYTRIFKGSKNLYFDQQSPNGIRQLKNATIDAGDFDADGDMDFIITGESLERPYTLLYENVQGFVFRDFMAGLPGVSDGTARFGDFDRDGDLDLYVTGIDVCYNLVGSIYRNTMSPARPIEDTISSIFIESPAVDFSRGPYYYFVWSACYCDLEKSDKKSYNMFISNIHKENKDFELNYKFNELLIKRFPGWGWSDRGHRTSNAFVSLKDAEEGRQQVIDSYRADGYQVYFFNW